jgi:hypothetical protein
MMDEQVVFFIIFTLVFYEEIESMKQQFRYAW